MDLYSDNIIFSLQRAGGISVYWCELLRRMLRDELSLHAIEGRNVCENIFRAKLNLPQSMVLAERVLPTNLARYLPPFINLPKKCLFHSSYYRLPRGNSCKTVTTVYDFTYERFRSGLTRIVHSRHKRFALQNASGVICISESTKRDLLDFVPDVHEDRIRVIHLGYSEEFRAVDEKNCLVLPELHSFPKIPYLVYVGDRTSYKNFKVAVEASSRVPGYLLVIVGGGRLSQMDQALLDKLLPARYIHLDRLPNEALNNLYNKAHALIYPSSYEGFGLPVIEAMAAGCPVIAVKSSSIPEVAGNAAFLVDTISADAFADCIKSLQNIAIRETLIQRGFKNARRFSWELCYQQTVEFYKEIIQS